MHVFTKYENNNNTSCERVKTRSKHALKHGRTLKAYRNTSSITSWQSITFNQLARIE
ncbi:hypothetical protein HanPSC8_Chr08g0329261 [Helianthus annuus]|nr:hypothetical protein HanPSC8_Chr08g0329261 [Helianthus annuus]